MEKFYIEYGKFIISFENINFQLCYIIRKICTSEKMFSNEDKRIEILLEGLTSYPILSKFNSLIKTTQIKEVKEVEGLIKVFYNNFVNVIELRNFIAHGTFLFGDPHGNVEKFQIRKPKLNKDGFQQNTNIISIEAFKKLNSELERLEDFIENLNIYLSIKTPINIKEQILKEMSNSLDKLDIKRDITKISI